MILDRIKKIFYLSLFTSCVLAFGISTNSYSQSLLNLSPKISISPANPGYGQTVTASVSMSSVNLEESNILWQINGETRKEGIGEKTFSFQTEKNGQAFVIKVTIIDQNGLAYESIYEVSPSEVELIIEPGSFTPPFYKGKSVFIPQGSAKIIAIANILSDGIRISNNNLIYKWKENGILISSNSGKGKNILSVNGSVPIKDIRINLEVSDTKGNIVGSAATTLTPYNANVIFYENNYLYGKMFNQALVNTKNIGTQEEFLIVAYPFYFNLLDETSGATTYKWSVGGESVVTEGDVNTLLLRQTGAKGETSIFLKIAGVSRIFQYASDSFNLIFGE